MRLDNYLFSIGKFDSRTKAKEAIERGEVFVNGKLVKPSYEISETDDISYSVSAGKYVSNGAFKLEKAFDTFEFSVEGKIAADIGASTGGFTQCLLLHGCKKVYALDVGESLLHYSLKNDSRVVSIENCNARFMDENTFGELIDVVVSDVSFISLTYIIERIAAILKDGGDAVVLIKPQFECGKRQLSKNGIVTDKKARADACLNIISFAEKCGLFVQNFSNAPIHDGKNVEFITHLKKGVPALLSLNEIASFCIKI